MEEARLLTIDEVLALEPRDVVWIEKHFEGEDNTGDPVEPAIVDFGFGLIGDGFRMDITKRFYDPAPMFSGGARYYKLWSARPSQEQRKKVAWDA